MLKIDDLSFDVKDTTFDYLGTAYMILIGLFQSGAGKKAGEFFTATCASILLARLATIGLTEVKNACDPCAGSGSLLLEVKNHLKEHKVGHFYSQELNSTTYNLNRMNMLLHGVPYKQFTAYNDDTLRKDNFYEDGKPVLFDIQVSNPPYSATNTAADPSFLDDERYSACGVLAPKTKADMQFVEHMVYHMSEDGRIAVLLPHGVLFRGAAEEKIRKWFIESLNVLDAVIGLPANLFHGTSIPVAVLVFKKKRNGNSDNIFFIDASREFEKGKDQNSLSDEHIDKIVKTYMDRVDVPKYAHKAPLSEIIANGYNLNIPRYVDTAEEEEEINLEELNATIEDIDKEISEVSTKLKTDFDELGLKFPF
jgi:type I restriction enzyme M protein